MMILIDHAPNSCHFDDVLSINLHIIIILYTLKKKIVFQLLVYLPVCFLLLLLLSVCHLTSDEDFPSKVLVVNCSLCFAV